MLAGYGVTSESNEREDSVLHYVDDMRVAEVGHGQIRIDENHGRRGSCHGDSGGPAFREQNDGSLMVVGVASRVTNPEGHCDWSIVYTEVGAYMGWLREEQGKIRYHLK